MKHDGPSTNENPSNEPPSTSANEVVQLVQNVNEEKDEDINV